MELNTASAVIRFAEVLEVESAQFYEDAASRVLDLADSFHGFARENRKNARAVKRTYYNVVSDALETGFSFGAMSSDPYVVDTAVEHGASPSGLIRTALANEDKIRGFYEKAADCSESLMADLPRLFKRLARNREQRISRLNELLNRS
jgi:rubrerythrin